MLRLLYRHKILLGCSVLAVVLCLTLISFLEQWSPEHISIWLPKHGNDPVVNQRSQDLSTRSDRELDLEYASRVDRVRDACYLDKIVALRRVGTNRRFGNNSQCLPKICPVIVDEKRSLLFCFVPKVGSTLVKRFLLNISGVALGAAEESDSTSFHLAANAALHRVSPLYYSSKLLTVRFHKMMFVRHPFDRLVSAFRDKAEKPREEMHFFYDRYFDRTMRKLRPTGSPIDQITFPEFVWMLTHTTDYDDHWAPYWSRCDPCLVDYDFIGKLETAREDFPNAFAKAGIHADPGWWEGIEPTPRYIALRYFAQVPEEEVLRLYRVYKLDFELFGYSVREFLPGNYTEDVVR